MDFGRLPNIDKIDFTLPPDHEETGIILGNQPASKTNIYVGCPIWGEKAWVGKIYPPKTTEKDFLLHYARNFNTIELNATHYKTPDDSTIERWTNAVTPGFKFCPKVPQVISHAPDITQMTELMEYFMQQVEQMGKHLGVTFLQLPPTFGPKKLPYLLNFLDSVPAYFQFAIELRHEGWFKNSTDTEDLFQYMKQQNIHTVITDVAGRRDVLHQRLTTKTAFIRFTANDLHPTDFTRLDEWIIRLKKWQAQGLENLYFFIHTPTKELCIELAHYFNQNMGLSSTLGNPPPAEQGYVQGSLF